MSQSLTPQSSLPNFAIDQGLEYYAGKSKLLDWVNRLLDLNLQRLEQLTSGAVYCQILDAFYVDKVAIRKVNFLAREEYEILPNYKVLQAAFIALDFTKELDVAKLSRASTSDLMELTQWLYKTFNGVITVPNYNPAARRQMSLKGATNNLPFPACVVNSSFEFGRSDLRTSGTWATGTPAEPTKLAPRALRSNSNTPGTNGKSASKRNTPYVNVASRYREGLAVPPEQYDRRSPRLSPGSGGGAPRRVHVSHGGTQTDFPEDEEYRPMTAADVGTEAVSPRPSMRDFGQGFGYELDLSRSESLGNASAPGVSSPRQAPESFGSVQQPSGESPLASLEPPLLPSRLAPALAEAGDQASAGPIPGQELQGLEDRSAACASALVANDLASSHGDDEVDAANVRTSAPGDGPYASESSSPRDGLGDGDAASPMEAALYTAFGAAGASAAAAVAAVEGTGDADGGGPTVDELAATAATISLVGAATGANGPDDSTDADQQPDSGSSVSLGTPAASTPAGGEPLVSARDAVSSPAPPSSASASAAATPSPRTAPWRSSGTVLPPEVAALLASPAARTRVATAACLRDMAAAMDASTAAVHAIDKSMDSYATLLAGASAPPTQAAGGAFASRGCSPALCGKARSLQDALATLLAHTSLLLSDVQAYSEATHLAPVRASTSKGGTPSLSEAGVAPSPRTEGGEGKPSRNYAAEAAALLEVGRSHETRLQALAQKSKDVLQLPSPAAAATDAGHSAITATSGPAANSGPGLVAAHRHLTDEQRKLCSTALLDGHLKAVGMAQFALVQGIHKELAAFTSTYFRHTGITQGGEGSTGGGGETSFGGVAGSTGGVGGSTGGVSTSSNRKARVFKLGEYQLKQLRNGDIYKGRYVCNKKNGEGVYHFINADVYEGEFREDRMDGYGVYTFSHEGRYEGQWRNAVYNGNGTETFAKGSTYHGEYSGGLRNGWGVCRFYNGDYYEGQWAKGLRDGSGMQQCTDDSNFVGDYHRGKRHGHGVYSFPNGDRYEGQYSEDLPHGHGTYHFASGQCYQGQWQQGKKHGWSVYTVEHGSRFMGLWSEGKPTWVQPLGAESSGAVARESEESGKALQQAMEARDLAVKAAAEARKRAAGHWEVGGPIQSKLLASLGQACNCASLSQQARRKACDLAARLDSAVALLQDQGGGAPVPSTTP